MNQPTQKQIAEALGITPRRVSTLKGEGMPVTSIEDAKQWRAEREDSGGAAELRRERIRLTRARADKEEHALAIQRGEYISRAEVKEHHYAAAAAISAAIIKLENDIPPLVTGLDEPAAQKAIRPVTTQVLRMLKDKQSEFWHRRPEP